ncbi:hypothetical protein [Priestia koreensis]|uniref:hypothetical protein n=1 Tax=Priestia koreensis TaxID=284581 RepID=UPI003016798B
MKILKKDIELMAMKQFNRGIPCNNEMLHVEEKAEKVFIELMESLKDPRHQQMVEQLFNLTGEYGEVSRKDGFVKGFLSANGYRNIHPKERLSKPSKPFFYADVAPAGMMFAFSDYVAVGTSK